MSSPSTGRTPTPPRPAVPPRPGPALRAAQAIPPGSGEPGIRPPAAEDGIVFRESFLVYLESCERPLLRRLGERLFARVLESKAPRQRPVPGRAPRQRDRPDAEPWTHQRLRALALDLDFAVDLLGEIGDEPKHSDPAHDDERRLQAMAPEWAAVVEELVRAIEEALDEKPRTP